MRRRRRGPLIPTLVVLVALVVLGTLFASIWSDVLWYRQLHFLDVYETRLFTQIGLFLGAAAIMGAAVAVSLVVAYRTRPIYAPVSAEQESLDRYRDAVEPLRRVIAVAVPAVLALFAGSSATQQWQNLLLWWNGVPFHQVDPQFHKDIGFFVFTLPWLQFLVGFGTAVVILSGLSALATHYLYGGLRLQGSGRRISAAARCHIGLLLAVFLLLRGVSYWLSRYALSTHNSSRITGLTYTDANAVLTARAVLAVIAVIVAALFVAAAFADRWRLIPLYGVALLVVSAIVVGNLYPAFIQQFTVHPTEFNYEREYIQRNISATRDAYGLGDIDVTDYRAQTTATASTLRADTKSLTGIRLLDPALISPTFRQLEQNKQYYAFPDALDVDRYTIGGKEQDTVVAVRELSLDGVAQSNWFNNHLVYTHGFGVVAAYGTQQGPDGKPVFFQQGIPSTGALGNYEPRVYFGEQSPQYSIVGGAEGGKPVELDYPDDNGPGGQRTTIYTGSGGVSLGSWWNRLVYAMKFKDQNILLSGQINSHSRIMYDRTPRARVQKVAPYLTLDGDPYPSVVNGRIVWIVDGYTTTARYPYSRLQSMADATSDTLTAQFNSVVALGGQEINYIRNSVKATVDAYDGSVTLYAWDEKDPILQTWRKIFPTSVKPLSAISGALMAHLRYPEDLFEVQRKILTKYHVTDAGSFFNGSDFWQIPDDPTRASGGQAQPPYYLTLAMPGVPSAAFSLTSDFIPPNTIAGTRNVLTGFLAADSNAGDQTGVRRDGYGKLRLLQLPRDTVVPAPGQVVNNYRAIPAISTQLNLQNMNGSSSGNGASGSAVDVGNLLTLPVGGGLLYVQPIYGRSTGSNSYPLLRKVIVAFGEQVAFADTLDQALDSLFEGGTTAGSGGSTTGSGSGTSTSTATVTSTGTSSSSTLPPSAQVALARALQDAQQAIQDGKAALARQDFTAYGRAQSRLQADIAAALAAQAQGGKAGQSQPVVTTTRPVTTASTPLPASSTP